MNHVTDEQIQAYIVDTLTESERTMIEEHVFTCDFCLEHYMKWIEINEQQLPNFTASENFTEEIMAKLPLQEQWQDTASQSVMTVRVKRPSSATKRLRPFVHYVIAASITLLLMSTGVFQEMTGLVSTIDQTPRQVTPSLTQNLMERALQWLDFNHVPLEEGEQL